MKLEVIIPVRNNPNKIFRILNSLDRQVRNRDDVIVTIADDCSTDETVQVIEAYIKDGRSEKFSLVRLTRRYHIGGARNFSAAKSTADYIVFFDSDDDIKNGLIGDIIEAIDKSQPDMVIWGFESLHDKVKTIWKPNLEEESYASVPVGVWFKAIKREKLVAFPEGVYCEDCVWWFLQADKIDKDKIEVLDKVGYTYDQRGASFSNAIVYLKKNPHTLESLAFDDILIEKGMNDRCPSDVLRCLADMYDARHMIRKSEVKQAWANRFSGMYKSILSGHWVY